MDNSIQTYQCVTLLFEVFVAVIDAGHATDDVTEDALRDETPRAGRKRLGGAAMVVGSTICRGAGGDIATLAQKSAFFALRKLQPTLNRQEKSAHFQAVDEGSIPFNRSNSNQWLRGQLPSVH